jgi:hypothetical protein
VYLAGETGVKRKKGLIYSSERGLIAFTVPHFGKFLRAQPV